MLIAHLSDLHIKTASDVIALERQLDRIARQTPDHLVVTGDLLDRWNPALLEQALDAIARHGFLHRDRLTILHGNHDLASSGGHPRGRADLIRLVLRSWDPPIILASRRKRFYQRIGRRGDGIAAPAPFLKALRSDLRIAVLDTVPLPWRPLRASPSGLRVEHAVGCIRPDQADWLASISGSCPLIILVHHYPLEAPEFEWTPAGTLRRFVGAVRVPMSIPPEQRSRFWAAASAARAKLVACGHVHRARLDFHGQVAVGLNGQAGADWAGRTIAYYDLSTQPISMTIEGTC